MAESFPEGMELWAGTWMVVQAGCVSSAHRGTGCRQRNWWHPKQTIKMFLLWRGVPQEKDDQLRSQGKHLLTFPCSRMTKLYILFDSPEVLASVELLLTLYLPWLEFNGSLILGELLGELLAAVNSGNFFHRPFNVHSSCLLGLAHTLLIKGNVRENLLECLWWFKHSEMSVKERTSKDV